MKANVRSLFFGCLATLGCVFVFLIINTSFLSKKENNDVGKVVEFEVKKQKKKKKFKRKKAPKKAAHRSLKPKMNSLLKGMNFGLPAFEMELNPGESLVSGDSYMDGSQVEVKPKVLYRPDLVFPEKALDESLSGFVVLGLFINKEGELEKVDVMESKPEGVFDKAALENVKRWKFKPAQHKGASVSTWQEQRITFSMEGGV